MSLPSITWKILLKVLGFAFTLIVIGLLVNSFIGYNFEAYLQSTDAMANVWNAV